jgi:hypothetical protein
VVNLISRGIAARVGLLAAVLAVATVLRQPIHMPRIMPSPSDPPVIRGSAAISWPLGPDLADGPVVL